MDDNKHFTNLVLKTLDDKPGFFEVMGDVKYIHGEIKYTVPKGFVTDLASIPIFFRSFFNVIGKSRKPAVFHDHMYEVKWKTRKDCDKAFKQMLIDRGISKRRARIYYYGVRLGGWTRGRW